MKGMVILMKDNKSVKISIRFTQEQKNEIDRVCAEKGVPLSQFIRNCVRKELEMEGK